MKPLKVTMSAFGSYGGVTEVDFRDVDHGLFLITGDTGAGKTTIFDAISFALFGELSGGARDGAMMRSQYAKEEETYVELIFSDRGEHFTVRRSPSYQRISKRKNKDGVRTVTTVPAKASLILPDGGEFPGRIGEVNEKIQEIVGVDRNQFAQIAMIAQGEYVKLLHASSKERKEIFGRIFNTGIYWRIQQKLKEENNLLYGKLQDNKNLYEHESGKIIVPETEEDGDAETAGQNGVQALSECWDRVKAMPETGQEEILEVLSRIVKMGTDLDQSAKNGLEQAIRGLSDRNSRLGRVSEKNRRLDGLEQAGRRLAALEESAGEWQRKRERQNRAEQALPVQAAREHSQNSEREWRQALERIVLLERELSELREPLEKISVSQREKEQRLEQERPKLAADIAGITEQLPVYLELEEKKKECGQAEKRLSTLREKLAADEGEIKELESRREMLRRRQEELEGGAALRAESAVRLEQLNARMQALEQLLAELNELEELYRQREQKRGGVEKAQTAYESASRDYEEKNHSFVLVQAGILASKLEEGELCPVCGSVHHPKKAELKRGDVTEKQVETARKKRTQTDSVLREELSSYQELHAGYVALGKQAQAEYGKIAGGKAETFTELKEESGVLSAECKKSLDEEKSVYESLKKREAAWEASRRELKTTDEQAEHLKQQLKEAQTVFSETELAFRQSAFQLEQLKKRLPWETKQRAEEELARCTSRLKQLEGDAREAAARREQLQRSVTEKSGYLASEREKSELAKEKKDALHLEWQELMKRRGFADEEEFVSALLSEKEIQELRKEIQGYDSECLKARAAYEQYRELTQGETREPEEMLREEISRLAEEKERLSAESSRLSAVRTGNDAAFLNIKKLLREREELRRQKQLIETLYTTADGKVNRAARIDFQTYVQRQYFKQMVSSANKRLLLMTEGRFLLQCRDLETLGRQGEVGLDLDVYCPDTDRTRDVKTLSGGESFMAALSMALGMADVIQNTAGRVNIEAMFIDEGFGSLDEDSRMKAIRILKELAGSRRLVGIISHVTELKEQMDRKLIVKKTEKGSSIRWELES